MPRPIQPPQLKAMPALERKSRFGWYVAACLLMLLGGSLTVLLLHTTLATGSFRIAELEEELATTQTELGRVQEELAARAEPGALTAAALELGMVESRSSTYLNIGDGTVLSPGAVAGAASDEVVPDASGTEGG
ncbi:MAG: hypothetical protein LBJ62_11295 [Bifidobacteriaceae bacterium]|jgi:hypothetical protein|nr:hypothetical protein [Bifidobacteriaceae bacterium]